MINISSFENFLRENFDGILINVNEFIPGIKWIDINCLADENRNLIIEISNDSIKVSTISKKPELDFSLYDYSFDNNNEAERLVMEIKKRKSLPAKFS